MNVFAQASPPVVAFVHGASVASLFAVARLGHQRLRGVVERLGQHRIDPLRVVQREAADLARVGREVRARRLRRAEQRLHGGVVLGVGQAADARRQQHRAARHDDALPFVHVPLQAWLQPPQ